MNYEYKETYKGFDLVSWGWSITAPMRDGILYTIFIYKKDKVTNPEDGPAFTMSCFISGQRMRNMSEEQRTELVNIDRQKLIEETKQKIDRGDFTDKLDI